jgi:hypothetical protein
MPASQRDALLKMYPDNLSVAARRAFTQIK